MSGRFSLHMSNLSWFARSSFAWRVCRHCTSHRAMADKQYATKAPDVEMMSRKGEAIPLGAAVAYCESLPPERRVPRSGCYVYECGSVPVSCGYHFASDSCLSWNLTTVPFGCFAAPLGYENPTYVSLKRDVAMILVDERKSTVACYGGTSKAKTPCCLCRRVF